MMYEVVTTEFRTELHARWSVFFDHLEVPWLYEPATFHDSAGTPRTPAFWLPRERTWFDAELEGPPPWWARFAAAANDHAYCGDGWAGDTEDSLPIEVGEEWRGVTMLALGWIPDGYGSTCHVDGPWRDNQHGMLTSGDACYQWTLCPKCGSFGAEYWGYAERLSCRCLDDREHRKVANGGDTKLMLAYRAAAEEYFPGQDHHPHVAGAAMRSTVRKSLIRQEGAAAAQQRCVGQCRSVGEEMRAELPEDAYVDTQDADTLCGACPGFVCVQCGEQPASAPGAACRMCEPVTLLTESQARKLINAEITDLARRKKEPLRAIHPEANRAMGVRRRDEASLEQIGVGLTQVERWLADPDSLQLGVSTLSDDEIDALNGKEVRSEIAKRVGPLCAALRGVVPAFVQIRINDVMGARSRADADDEQLREGLRQVQKWLHSPATYHQPAEPAQI